MKKIFNLFSMLTLLLMSCGNSNENEATEETKVNAFEGTETDLTTYGLPYTMILPKSENAETEIVANDFGGIDIRQGEGYMIALAYGEGDLARFKTDLNNDLLYKATIIDEGETYIIYKREIESSGMEPEYHFFLVAKFGSDIVEIQNLKDVIFKEEGIRKMQASAQTLKPRAGA